MKKYFIHTITQTSRSIPKLTEVTSCSLADIWRKFTACKTIKPSVLLPVAYKTREHRSTYWLHWRTIRLSQQHFFKCKWMPLSSSETLWAGHWFHCWSFLVPQFFCILEMSSWCEYPGLNNILFPCWIYIKIRAISFQK